MRETIFREYGVYLATHTDAYSLFDEHDEQLRRQGNVAIVSQPDWVNTIRILEERNFGSTTVLTPELVTVAGIPLSFIPKQKQEAEQALSRVAEVSKQRAYTAFVIGSPYFIGNQTKPYNAAIVFKDGEISRISLKRLLAGEEFKTFSYNPDFCPMKIGDATLLVCRDLIGAEQSRLVGGYNGVADYVFEETGDEILAERFRNTEFIANGSRRILVSACWGVGSPVEGWENVSQEVINDYYLENLRSTCQTLFELNDNLDQIVVCDRAVRNPKGQVVSDRPMSAVFFRT